LNRSSSIASLVGALAAVAAAGGGVAWLDALRASHGAGPPAAWWEVAALAAHGGRHLTVPALLTVVLVWLASAVRARRSQAGGRCASSSAAALTVAVLAGWAAALVVALLSGFSIKVGWIGGALLVGLLAGCLALRCLPRGVFAGGPGRGAGFTVAAAAAAALLWGAMWVGPAGETEASRFGQEPAKRPDVLLIVVDALRPDHLGAYGYGRPTSPRIDRLAASGVLFADAVSPSSWTLPAMASLFTSSLPGRHGALERGDRLPAGSRTFVEVMRAAGYRTAGFAPNPWMKRNSGFDRGFDEYYDMDRLGLARRLIGVRLKNFALRRLGRIRIDPELVATAEDLTSRALRWMRRNDERPFFLLLHYMDVHSPYVPPSPYRGAFCAGHLFDLPDHRLESRFRAGRLESDSRILEHIVELYDEGILATDASVGRLLDGMEAAGLAARTAVIFTADHGEEFLEHGGTMHGRTLHQEVIRIPLLIRPPDLPAGGAPAKSRVTEDRVSLLDLYPTILDLAGLTSPGPVEGVSLASRLDGTPAPAEERAFGAQLYHEGSAWSALLRGGEKIIRVRPTGPGATGAERLEIYDLREDPGERANLAASNAERAADLLALLAEREASWGIAGLDREPAEEPIDPETLEQLRALGYVH